MKLVRSAAFCFVLIALSLGGISVGTPGADAQTWMPTPHPCQQPGGFDAPVQIDGATASTQPRLVTDREIGHLYSSSPPPRTGLSVGWAWFGWLSSAANENEVIYSGLWALPRTGALTFGGGRGAIVTVQAGDVVLLVCGADGEIDYQEGDNASTPLAAGSSTTISAGTSFFVFLSDSPATYWLFGNRQGDPPESVVTIEIIGNNGGPQVCGITNCWPAPVLSGKPDGTACDGDTCTVPGSPGGCGGIYCWTR